MRASLVTMLLVVSTASNGEVRLRAAQTAKPAGKQATQPDAGTRVVLAAGQPSVVRKGTVVGQEDVPYVVTGRKGQVLTVDLQTTSTSLYFNVLPIGDPEAIYASDRGETGNTASITLPSDGDYRVVVYLFRNAARRGAKASFTLALSLK